MAEEYSEIMRESGRPVPRYFRPISVAGMCLSCHGPSQKIPAEVRKMLAARYPADKATGCAAGDLRGVSA